VTAPVATGAVLPAQPGTRILDVLEDDGRRFVIASPVIAWIVRADGPPTPVTARGPDDGIPNRDYVVEFPDGAVVAPDVGTWPHRHEFLTALGQLTLPLENGPTSNAPPRPAASAH
jgi:hypothetical protein